MFSVEWEDKGAFTASRVAVTTGGRSGECLALRRSDIGKDTLNIQHSYSVLDGLKTPKNGHKRAVPLLPEVRVALLDLLRDNPHQADDSFVFYSLRDDRPVDPKVILDGLHTAIDKLNAKRKAENPDAEIIDWKGRGIVFHSWRHYFCSRMTDVTDGEKTAKVSGHLSESVFKKYSDHIETKNIAEVSNAAASVFSNILQFQKKGARYVSPETRNPQNGRTWAICPRRTRPNRTYKQRNETEMMFDRYKSFMKADVTYMQNRYVLEGWLFTNFIAMMTCYKLYTKLRETGLVGKYSPLDIIEMSKAVYQVRISGTWHLAEVTAKVRKLLAKAGIDYLNERS